MTSGPTPSASLRQGVGMPSERPRSASRLVLIASLLLVVSFGPTAAAMDADMEDALLKLEAVLEMAELSEDLWPAWDISETPFAVRTSGNTWYLINHPRPPAHFERVREQTSLRIAVYTAPPGDIPASGACVIEGLPTAVLDLGEGTPEMLPSAFSAAFRAHTAQACEDRMEPIELLSGYPVDAWNLVLADIECRLLFRAASAPEDSLDLCVKEFASIRRHRRLRMGGRYAEFERRIEFTEGTPMYLAERCRREAEPYIGGRHGRRLRGSLGEPGALERCFPESPGLDWYRGERFRWTGAVLCFVADRYMRNWKEVCTADCVDPFEVMWREVKGSLPRAREVLDRFGYEELVASMTTTIEQSKTDAERLFEGILRSGSPTFSVSTHLLSSASMAKTEYRFATLPLVMNPLVPLITYSSPSRRAVVRMAPASEPAPASVRQKAARFGPSV